jgi:hypothetical protein
MGLDWEPLGRPRPEHGVEFATLLARLQAGDETVLDRMNAIAITPYETLGAPRIGIDDAADDWLHTQVSEDDHYETCMKMHGYYVLDLLPPCDGFPVYTSYPTWPKLDRCTFRGALLLDVRDDLGALYHEAFLYKSHDELEEFGERIMARTRQLAREQRVMEVELVAGLPSYVPRSIESRVHIMFAAARWCLFWARRGHGLAP